MNNYVYEPIPEIYTSAIKFSPPMTKGVVRDPVLIISARNEQEATSFNYQDILSYRNSNLGIVGKVKLLNALNLHRNGSYQHPSWKQLRTGQHKVSRYLRRRNFIGCTQDRYLVRPGPNNSSEKVTVEKRPASGDPWRLTDQCLWIRKFGIGKVRERNKNNRQIDAP